MKKFLMLLILLASSAAFAQLQYISDRAVAANPFNGGMVPLSYAQVRVCTVTTGLPAPCPNLAQIYDVNGNPYPTSLGSNFGQLTTDVLGRFNFACTTGNYNIQVQASGNNTPSLNYIVSCPGNVSYLPTNNTWTGTNTFLQAITATGGVIGNLNGVIGATTPNAGTFTTFIAKDVNGVKNASQYAGLDIGVWINAAYADLPAGGGQIMVPAAATCYPFTTPIVFGTSGKVVQLVGQGNGPVCLNFTGASGTAITVNTGQFKGTLISNIKLTGGGGTSIGIVLGGSQGAYGSMLSNVDVSGFAVGLQFASNTWQVLVSHSLFSNNTQNLLYPGPPNQPSNAGEQITFLQTFFADSGTTNFANNVYIYAPSGLSMQFISCGFDQAQVATTGDGASIGTVSIMNSHFEVPNGGESRPFVKNQNTNLYMAGDDFLNAFATVQTYPITTDGGGQDVYSALRVNGGNSSAVVGTLNGHTITILGTMTNPTNPTVAPYAQIDATYSGVTVLGDIKFAGNYFTNKWFTFRTGPDGANNGGVSLSGEGDAGQVRMYRWTGVGTIFNAFKVTSSLTNGELDFCQGTQPATPDAFGSETYTCNASILNGGQGSFNGGIKTPNMHAITGTNYVCVDTNGNFVKSTTACSGT